MEHTSSPASWFLREKDSIVGLTQVGIKAINKQGITSLVLPSKKDRYVFDRIDERFYQNLAEYAPSVIELCVPPELSVGRYGFRFSNHKSPVCSIKKLVFFSDEQAQDCYIHYNFSEETESVELSGFSRYLTIDGVIYNSDGASLLYYPRSKPGDEFTTPDTVTCIWENAFTNTKNLKKLICSKDLECIGPSAFDHTSITELVTPSGTIKDNAPLTNAFKNCPFTIPSIVPAFTDEQARQLVLKALQSEESLPDELFKYITAMDDELIDAFIGRLKREDNRKASSDLWLFIPLLDRTPMTEKLYAAYVYLLNYKDWEEPRRPNQPNRIHDSLQRFKMYWLTGHKGEVQWDEAFDVGCYITGYMPSKLSPIEENVKEWLKQQILESIELGKKLFITKTCSGVCCMAAEIVLELKRQYQDIHLLLFWSVEYEYENVGFGKWDHLARGIVYDRKPTEKSLEWKTRLDAIKEQADMYFYIDGDTISWTIDHCSRIITTWQTSDLDKRLLEQVDKKNTELVFYSAQ